MSVTSVVTGHAGAASAAPGGTAAPPLARTGWRGPAGPRIPGRGIVGPGATTARNERRPEVRTPERPETQNGESGEQRSGARPGHGPAGRGVRGALRPVPHARCSGHRGRRLSRLPLLRLDERRDARRYGCCEARRCERRDAPGHGGSAMAPAAAHPVAAHQGPAFRAGTGAGPRGAVCVSTPARDRTLFGPGLSGPAVLALPAVRPSRGRAVLLGGTGRRGPPVSGRSLLLRVCVARA